MAAHLDGYLVSTSSSDGLRSAAGAARSHSGERLGAPLLVDDAADVLAAAAVASPVKYGVGDDACGATQGEAVGDFDSAR